MIKLIITIFFTLASTFSISAQTAKRTDSDIAKTTENVGKTQVIAHRGFWGNDILQQNTLYALKKAQEIGIYGSELDVNLTKDGILVVCHGPKVGDIQNVQYADFKNVRKVQLANGETVPTFDEYLELGKKDPNTKLIVEIKPHDSSVLEKDALQKVIKSVKKHKMKKQVEFISFSFYICKELARLMPDAQVAYLGGEIAPNKIKEAKLTGIDYNQSVFIQNPQWIKQAHDLGLTVNVWTVSDKENIEKFRDAGVNFITTNDPVSAINLCK